MPRLAVITYLCLFSAIAVSASAQDPLAPVKKGIHAPVPITAPEAIMPAEARRSKTPGLCIVSLIVDVNGLPQNPTIIRCSDPMFGQNSLDAVRKYRFQPARRIDDGEPVPAKIAVEINYRFSREPFEPPAKIESALASPPGTTTQPDPALVKVYKPGHDVTSPGLQGSEPSSLNSDKCLRPEAGQTTLFAIVDTEGKARNIYFVHPLATELDKLAIALAEQDRFTLGTKNGAPVPVAISLRMTLHGCWSESQSPDGKINYHLGLTDQPVQEVSRPVDPPAVAVLVSGNGMTNPDRVEPLDSPAIPLFDRRSAIPVLHCSSGALREQHVFEVRFDVDRQGMPENVELTKDPMKASGEILSAAILRLRFKPAFKGGRPMVTHDVIQVACGSSVMP